MIGKFVIVRTRSAGVHMGTLTESSGTAVLLRDARRLWSWRGAFTLHEVSLHGCDESSRISEAVMEIGLTEAIEVIPCTETARKNLVRSRNGAPQSSG
jgi:hypothetical protein